MTGEGRERKKTSRVGFERLLIFELLYLPRVLTHYHIGFFVVEMVKKVGKAFFFVIFLKYDGTCFFYYQL